MILRVLFPHDDEQGHRYAAGDLREVPGSSDDAELVALYTRQDPRYKTALLGFDKSFDQEWARKDLPLFSPEALDEDQAAARAQFEADAAAELAAQQALMANARAVAEAAAAAEADAQAARLLEDQAKAAQAVDPNAPADETPPTASKKK